MKNAMKKLLSLALALVLVASVFPMAAFAAEGDIYDVTVKVKVDNSNEIYKEFEATVLHGDEYPIAEAAEYNCPDYTFSHYWTETTGEQTVETITITDKTTIEVRMLSKDQGNDDAPAAGDAEEDDEPTYTVRLNVYQIKDDEAKEWSSESITLTKNSATLSELAAAAGYTDYESIYAKADGASFEGRAAIAIEDGMQIDLFVTPNRGSNRPSNNKPDTDTKPDTSNKPSTDSKPGKGEKVTLRVWHNDGTSNFTDIRCRTTDNLLDVINGNDELSELERDGYKLIGWAFEANNDKEQEWIAAQHTVADDDDLRVYADWQETKPGKGDDDGDGEDDVILRIYVNGNTKSVAKVVNMEKYAGDGKITHSEAEKVVRKYYEEKYTDDDMDVDGLFTKSTWNGGKYDMDDAKSSIRVNEKGDTIIYVMVRDAQKISSGTADSTNPKTGDTIFVAVTVMALSATALAAVYVFNKKRAVK